jgi:arginase
LHSIDVQIVGADIVEFNPTRDLNDMTAMVAIKLYKELCGKMIERKPA